MNKKILLTIGMLYTLSSFNVFAADEVNTSPGLTAAGAPLGLHGTDPVAFLEINNRISGNASFASTHNDVTYYFSTEKNKAMFEEKPQKYIPQNGGFCTYGVSVGKKFNGDPNYFDVVNGKIYVFLSEDIYKLYQEDKTGVIAKAKRNWRKIKNIAATEL